MTPLLDTCCLFSLEEYFDHSQLFPRVSIPFLSLGRQFSPGIAEDASELNHVFECLFGVRFNDLDHSDDIVSLGAVPPVNADYVGIQTSPLIREISATQESRAQACGQDGTGELTDNLQIQKKDGMMIFFDGLDI